MADLFGDKQLLTKEHLDSTESSGETARNDQISGRDALSNKHFVPLLKDIYTELRHRDEPLEIVFLSFDKTKEEMTEYFMTKHGNWLAVPFDDPIKNSLAERYSISVIPKLIVVQPNGDVITNKGRKDIIDKGVICMRAWRSSLILREDKKEVEDSEQKNEMTDSNS